MMDNTIDKERKRRMIFFAVCGAVSILSYFAWTQVAHSATLEATHKMECYSGGVKIREVLLAKRPQRGSYGTNFRFLDGTEGMLTHGAECYFTEIGHQTAEQKRSGAIVREGIDKLLGPGTPE